MFQKQNAVCREQFVDHVERQKLMSQQLHTRQSFRDSKYREYCGLQVAQSSRCNGHAEHLLAAGGISAAAAELCMNLDFSDLNVYTENCDKIPGCLGTSTRHLRDLSTSNPTALAHQLAWLQASTDSLKQEVQHVRSKATMSSISHLQQQSLAGRSPDPAAAVLGTSALQQLPISSPSTALKQAVTPQPEQQPPQLQNPAVRKTMRRVETSRKYTPLRIEPLCTPAATAEALTVPLGPRAAHRHLAAALYSGLTALQSAESVHQSETIQMVKHQSYGELRPARLQFDHLQSSAGIATNNLLDSPKSSAASMLAPPLRKTRSNPSTGSCPQWDCPCSSQLPSVDGTTATDWSQLGHQRHLPVGYPVPQFPGQQHASRAACARGASGITTATQPAGGSYHWEADQAGSIQTQEDRLQNSGCQLLPGWQPNVTHDMECVVVLRPTRGDAAEVQPAPSDDVAVLVAHMAMLLGRGAGLQGLHQGFCGLQHDWECLLHIMRAAGRDQLAQSASRSDLSASIGVAWRNS